MRSAGTALFLVLLWSDPAVAALRAATDRPEKQMQEIMQAVQLTPEQKEKVKQIHQGSRVIMDTLHDDLEKRREDLNRLLETNSDDETLRLAFQNLQSVKRTLELARFEKMLAIRALLTDQQRAVFQNQRQSAQNQ